MDYPNLVGAQVFTWGVVEADGTAWEFVPASWWDWIKALLGFDHAEKLVRTNKVAR